MYRFFVNQPTENSIKIDVTWLTEQTMGEFWGNYAETYTHEFNPLDPECGCDVPLMCARNWTLHQRQGFFDAYNVLSKKYKEHRIYDFDPTTGNAEWVRFSTDRVGI